MLLRGFGLTKDEPKAVGYMKAAAEKGIPGAQNRMANIIAEGIGGTANMVEALKWRLLAKDHNVQDVELDAKLAKMSKADKAAGEKAAQEWRDQNAMGTVR
jgi:TPR repeat protein